MEEKQSKDRDHKDKRVKLKVVGSTFHEFVNGESTSGTTIGGF